MGVVCDNKDGQICMKTVNERLKLLSMGSFELLILFKFKAVI